MAQPGGARHDLAQEENASEAGGRAQRPVRGYIAIGTTALTSISIFARGSISAATCTAVIAG